MFKTKLIVDGSINKYRVRLLVKGYAQMFGVVTRSETIRLLPALAACKIFQSDLKFAFLNGVLEEEIYLEQLDGFTVFRWMSAKR